MKRIQTPIRTLDDASVQTDSFASQNGYWVEGEAYEINSLQATEMREAALSLTKLYNDTMDIVSSDKKYADQFVFTGKKKKDRKIYEFAADQWQKEKSKGYVLDRWDIAWNGVSPPKLLERNFGYVGLIAGTASVQEDYIHWLSKQEGFARIKSFGNLQTSFIDAFRRVADECGIPANSRIAVTAETVYPSSDRGMVRASEIICRWIKRAGYDPVKIEIEDLLYTGQTEAFIRMPNDLQNRWQQDMNISSHRGELLSVSATIRITQDYCFPFSYFDGYARDRALFSKESPKQRRGISDLFDHLAGTPHKPEVIMLQPYWSLLMGHKAMLPIMYELNPNHPNLLPTYFDAKAISGSKHVVKRANGYQGIGSKIVSETGEIIASRHFKKGQERLPYRNVYQQYAASCEDDAGGYRVFHLFTTNGKPAALGTRVAPASFVGGDDTQTKYMPVFINEKRIRKNLTNEV